MNLATHTRQPGTGQETLFLDPQELAAEVTEGISVSIRDRDEHLVHALTLLAKVSMRDGLQQAVTSPDHLPELEGRYGDNLPVVVSGAARRAGSFLIDAKWQFAYAGGYFSLGRAGNPDEAKAMARADFSEFWQKYGGSDNASARDAYRKRLRRNLR